MPPKKPTAPKRKQTTSAVAEKPAAKRIKATKDTFLSAQAQYNESFDALIKENEELKAKVKANEKSNNMPKQIKALKEKITGEKDMVKRRTGQWWEEVQAKSDVIQELEVEKKEKQRMADSLKAEQIEHQNKARIVDAMKKKNEEIEGALEQVKKELDAERMRNGEIDALEKVKKELEAEKTKKEEIEGALEKVKKELDAEKTKSEKVKKIFLG